MKICKDYISLFFEILKRYGHIEYDYIDDGGSISRNVVTLDIFVHDVKNLLHYGH